MDETMDLNDEASLAPFVEESVNEYFQKVMANIKLCQKHSITLSKWQRFADYSAVGVTMAKIKYILHGLINKIFNHQDIKLDINGYNLQQQFDILREGNDALFERVNADLDEASGIRRNIDLDILDSTVRTIRGPVNPGSGREIVLIAPRNVQKPQIFFTAKIDNSPKEPFIPIIKEKPNSIKPLSILICLNEDSKEYYSHPYEYELQHWTPSGRVLIKKEPIQPQILSNTPLLLVQTVENLQLMIEELKKSTEIAVDLEHHSFRTYQGLTCLIQISTRVKDYIVDPFPIRDDLPLLNEVFTDPKITKVLHGADHDILWLQRDCGVYVVNLFDTHQAAVVLEYPHRSLAALLQKFCSINANKIYQRADWRVRPIPDDFIEYARQDSHYLLYIYDMMRNELIEKGNELNNLIHSTYNRSTELCMKRYEKPIIGPESHLDLYRKSRKNFNSRQMFALQQIYLWRDKIARQQDESVDYVLPKHMMLQIAEVLPKEMQGILACCNPVPTLVKTEQLTLHQIIRAARELPLGQIEAQTSFEQSNNSEAIPSTCDVALTLICKHDLSLVEDRTSGLSTLLNPQETMLGDLFNESIIKAELKKNSGLYGHLKDTVTQTRHLVHRKTNEFMSPYERYKAYLNIQPLLEEEQEKKPIPDQIEHLEAIEHIPLSNHSAQKDDSNKKIESDADKERVLRLQQHLAERIAELGLKCPGAAEVATVGTSPTKKKKKKNQKFSLKEKIQKESEKQYKKQNETTSLKRKSTEIGIENKKQKETFPLKRKSTEIDIENLLKKIRTETEFPDEDKSSEMEADEEPFNSLKDESNEAEEVKPYDYSAANYNIFRKKKNKSKKFQTKITQNFRGKGSNKPTGAKKSGLKSFSWGSKKTN